MLNKKRKETTKLFVCKVVIIVSLVWVFLLMEILFSWISDKLKFRKIVVAIPNYIKWGILFTILVIYVWKLSP